MKHIFALFTGLLLLVTPTIIHAANITTGLVGEWLFEGNANDTSGNNLHGVVNGASLTTDRFGNTNSAYEFAADVNSRIVVPDNPLLNFTSEFSVSYWAKFNQPWTYHEESLVYKFDLGGSAATHAGWHVGVNQDDGAYGAGNYVFNFEVPDGTASIPQAQELVTYSELSLWHHVVGVYGSSALELYVDGSLVESITGPPSVLAATVDLVFGGSVNPVSGAFNRDLDDVRIYDRALSADDVSELHAIPEPSRLLLSLLGLSMVLVRRRRQRRVGEELLSGHQGFQ